MKVWVKVGLLSFGGPAGQIAVMHKILVEEKAWVSEDRFLHALNYCMLLPGPEAQQLAVYIGWLLHGWAGGMAAGCLFVLPGFLSILALSVVYAVFLKIQMVTAFFFGLKAATLAVVIEAVFRIGKKALKNRTMVGLAGVAFLAIFLAEVPFPVIILLAGCLGMLGGRYAPERFCVIRGHDVKDSDETFGPEPGWGRALKVLALGLSLWFGPILALRLWLGPDHAIVIQAVFFSKAAVVTFGGAYSVLAYVAQQAVKVYGWLLPGEMLDGLGMAETTPGPLIQVVQFVAFMGAYRHPGSLPPLTAAVLASVVTAWVTFVPCFLWIFLGAPYIERLRGNRIVSAGLSTITAAVVGVVLNLAVWFAVHVAFHRVEEMRAHGLRWLRPDVASVDWPAVLIGSGAFFALFKLRWNMIATLLLAALVGNLWQAFRALL